MFLNLYSFYYSSRVYLYYFQFILIMDSNMQCNFLYFNLKKDFIGRMFIIRVFLRVFSECEDMYIQYMVSYCGYWLLVDYIFKVFVNIGYWSN